MSWGNIKVGDEVLVAWGDHAGRRGRVLGFGASITDEPGNYATVELFAGDLLGRPRAEVRVRVTNLVPTQARIV